MTKAAYKDIELSPEELDAAKRIFFSMRRGDAVAQREMAETLFWAVEYNPALRLAHKPAKLRLVK